MAPTGLRIGELARRTGLSPDSLRHYEGLGLLPPVPRSMGGARRFPAAAEHQVRVIQSALRIGFTLGELAEILSERRRGGAPCRKVYALACAKLQTLEARLRDLQTLRDALEATLGGWKARLEGTAEGARAGLLDALTEELSVAPRPSPFARRSATP